MHFDHFLLGNDRVRQRSGLAALFNKSTRGERKQKIISFRATIDVSKFLKVTQYVFSW